MNHVTLKTKRTEMKFPLPFITPSIVTESIKDQETIQFMDAVDTMDYTQKEAQSFIDFLKYTETSDTELELGIFDNTTNKFIGMCSLENINQNEASCELGYWLNKSYTGKGYMSECTHALIQYAKDEMHIKTIDAFVISEHLKSIHLLEKLGFVQVNLLINDTENKGKLVNRYHYQLILQ